MEKKKYTLLVCAEDYMTGQVMLTDKEYALVKRVLDPKNWSNLKKTGPFVVPTTIKPVRGK